MTRNYVAAGVVVAALLGGLAVTARGDTEAAATAAVLREEFRSVVTATGKLEAAVAFEVGPPSARDFWNYNLQWMTPEGTRVKKGDVVARFDASQIDDQLREHRAALETAEQQREKEQRNLEVSLKQLRLDLVKAESTMKRLDLDLAAPEGIVAGIELEAARLERDLAVRRVAFLKDKIKHEKRLVKTKLQLLTVKKEFAQQKIEFNESVKDKFTVRAPVDGLVVYVLKRNGDRWEVGESVWMLAKILKVADLSTLRVEANVLEVDAARIAVGQPSRITVDAIPGLQIDSKIGELGRIVHERSQQDPSKVFDAVLPLGDVVSDQLRPGMGIKVEIETARLDDQLTLPLDAIRTSSEGTYVELRTGRGSERRPVELGARNRTRVVVEAGLEVGDVVVLEGRA